MPTSDGTNVRDPLNLNKHAHICVDVDMTPEIQKKSTIRTGLDSLPAPLNDYEIVVPDEVDVIATSDITSIAPINETPDAEDIAMEAKLFELQFAEDMFEKCSTSIKRKLPIPSTYNPLILRPPAQDATDLQKAEELIKSEMLVMNQYDCTFGQPEQFVLKRKTKVELDEYLQKNQLEYFTEDEILDAQCLLEEEIKNVKLAMDHGDISVDTYAKVWEECYAQVMFLPGQNRYTRASLTSKKDRIEAMERKLEARFQGLIKGLQELTSQIDLANIEKKTYSMLKEAEDLAIPRRLQAISEEVERQTKREELLQKRYQELMEISKNSNVPEVEA